MPGTEEFRVGPDEDPDRYRLLRLHSSGGEGQVWMGTRELDGGVVLSVAVKILHAERQDLISEWRDRWTEQVELLRSLQYPGVVPVREAFEGPLMHPIGQKPPKGRSLYLVMNWIEGESLHEWVSRRPDHDVFEALRLLTQVADALDYMHSGRATDGKPVVHRDVKPANIIVSDGVAVLVDFGLVRALTRDDALAPGIGTVSYMAPEVMSSGAYTPESDRYALGCVAYYMLTSEDPPANYDLGVMRTKLATVPALGANPSLLDHLMTMLDPDPAARPPKATAWVQLFRSSTLTEAGGRAGLPPLKPPPPPAPSPGLVPDRPSRRKPLWAAAAVMTLLLLLATAGYAMTRDGGSARALTAPPSSSTVPVIPTVPTPSSTIATSTTISRPSLIPTTSVSSGTFSFEKAREYFDAYNNKHSVSFDNIKRTSGSLVNSRLRLTVDDQPIGITNVDGTGLGSIVDSNMAVLIDKPTVGSGSLTTSISTADVGRLVLTIDNAVVFICQAHKLEPYSAFQCSGP